MLTLTRLVSDDEGTLGVLEVGGRQLWTMELPWRDNARCLSCIPAGRYRLSRVVSPRFGQSVAVRDVPGRSHILFHAGNWAGNVEKGLRSNSKGCIMPGLRHGRLLGQRAVLVSRPAFRQVLDAVPVEDELVVEEGS